MPDRNPTGSGSRIQNIFDPGSGMENSDPGSGINIPFSTVKKWAM
jgi:hypothetical protein